jgi:alkylated DNA nucleotide flippase Atl1
MPKLSLLQKLETAQEASFEVLDTEKSKRMGGAKTLYIPSVDDVAHAIKTIPKGEIKTIEELRSHLAKIANADTACPAKTIKYWKWMANLSQEALSQCPQFDIPWWRVLKDGKPSRHMPGGVDNQISMLKSEGINI